MEEVFTQLLSDIWVVLISIFVGVIVFWATSIVGLMMVESYEKRQRMLPLVVDNDGELIEVRREAEIALDKGDVVSSSSLFKERANQ